MGWFDQIVFWHWWILAGVLLILELTAPSYFFLWLGIAAATVGFVALAIGTISVQVQLLTFGVLALIAVVAWRRYRETQAPEAD